MFKTYRHYSPDPANNPANGGAAGGNPAGGAGAGDAKSYTQAQLDAMFGERAKSAAASARSEMLKALGFDKEDDAKAAISQYKSLTEAQKSEAQKLAERATTAEKERDDAKAALTEKQKLADERLLRADVMNQATKAGFADPEDAWAFIDKAKLTIDGETVKGTKEQVDALLKAKPHLKGGAGRAAPNINAQNNTQNADPLAGREKELAQRFRINLPRSK